MPFGLNAGKQPQMKSTRSAFVMITVAGALLGSQMVFAVADSPPRLNVGPSCDSAARGAISIGRDKEACLNDERSAQELLTKNWSGYTAAHKTQCVGMTSKGGSPSYVELISCLEIMRDAAAINKVESLSGGSGRDTTGARSSQPANLGLR